MFAGPYRDGPPPEALEINSPELNRFGLLELRRMALTAIILISAIVRAIGGWALRRDGRAFSDAVSEGVVNGFEQLGPTYVKLGQLIASSPSLFPKPLTNACTRMLDNVGPFTEDQARRLISEDLGACPDEIFTSWDPTPLSAASIAQVHACVLADGRDAVVKLQRPKIAWRMNTDLRIMYFLASKILTRIQALERANVVAIVEDLYEVTNQELNFALEAHRQDRFRNNIGAFGDNSHITAPEVYWDYCGPRIICMERMRGIPMDNYKQIQAQGVDGELILRRGIKVWAEAAMVHGPFHGDVHAGNLWVLEDNRACYLDFGIMGELTEPWRRAIADLLYTAMIDQDYRRVVRAYQSVGVMAEDLDPEIVGPIIAMTMEPVLQKGIGGVSLGDQLKSNMELAEQFGVTTPKELVLITKQLLYFERYATRLAPDYVLARDIFLLKNIFPEAVTAKAQELGIELPD